MSRSWYYSTSNNSQIVQDRAINDGLIESHTWSVELRHFQLPWTTPNPDFKVRPFFDAEYLQNGCRYGHSYYGRRIGNRTQLSNGTSLNDLEWPITQISGHDIIQRQITQKWYNVEPCLQWRTNRKSYMIYRTAPFLMILNDPYPQFQGHDIL